MPATPLKLADNNTRRPSRKINFTMAALAAIKPPASGRVNVSDSKQAGLMLTVTSNGHRSFFYYRKINGRPKKLKIGDYPEWTVDAARKEAVKTHAAYLAGDDPMQDRQKVRGELTLGTLHEFYVEQHAKQNCTERTLIAERSLWKTTLESMASRKLSEIKRARVKTLHTTISTNRGKTTANRSVQLLRRLYRFASTMEYYEGPNPCEIELHTETSRERYLTADELPKIIEAVDAEADPYPHFFRLALLTGARRSNLQAMAWADIDFTRKIWTVPDSQSKNRSAMNIPLTRPALAILKWRKRANEKMATPSPYVFPAQRVKTRQHIGQPTEAWRRICKAARIEGLHIHDLRRSMGAWQAAGGASLLVIGRSLGHRDQRSTQVYARMSDDPVRLSMEAAAKAMFGKEAK